MTKKTNNEKAEKEKKPGQFLLRNVVWNKHYTNILSQKEPEKYIPVAEGLLEDLKQENRINYCVFSIERGKKQNKASFHFQGYIEFDRKVDAVAFKKEWGLSDVQNRNGTQRQAIDYVKKERSKIHDKIYEFGIPKKMGIRVEKYNRNDPDIPSDLDGQMIVLNNRLKEDEEKKDSEKRYPRLEDIERDMPLLFLKKEAFCRNVWNRYNPVDSLQERIVGCVWVYGDSRIGKSTWSRNYLREIGYKKTHITPKKASREHRPKLWFEFKDERKKVLHIEEIRENFPEFNDVIELIDGNGTLEVKGSHIRNNYELIIFNSLDSPQRIYRKLPSGNQLEILNRIYRGRVDNKVFELVYGKDIEGGVNSWWNSYRGRWVTMFDRTKDLPEVIVSADRRANEEYHVENIEERENEIEYITLENILPDPIYYERDKPKKSWRYDRELSNRKDILRRYRQKDFDNFNELKWLGESLQHWVTTTKAWKEAERYTKEEQEKDLKDLKEKVKKLEGK